LDNLGLREDADHAASLDNRKAADLPLNPEQRRRVANTRQRGGDEVVRAELALRQECKHFRLEGSQRIKARRCRWIACRSHLFCKV
jgi:hypothetical protein